MKIMFTGGGTLGPVTPLLAVVNAWKNEIDDEDSFVWVGTPGGPERAPVEEAGIPFFALPVLRFPRYISLEWLTMPFRAVKAFWHAWKLLRKEKPDLIATAGGFTGVPLIIVGRLLGVRAWIHQQDAVTLLSNRLVNPFTDCVSTAWPHSKKDFSGDVRWLGNPARASILNGSKKRANKIFGLNDALQTVLVFGGGTGSRWLNDVMREGGSDLAEQFNVIHITGKDKFSPELKSIAENYYVVEYLGDEMADAYAAADVVVARAGMGTITELSALKKPSIIIPLPHSAHQIKNALLLREAEATLVFQQEETAGENLIKSIKLLLDNESKQKQLSENISSIFPTDVATEMAKFAKICVN